MIDLEVCKTAKCSFRAHGEPPGNLSDCFKNNIDWLMLLSRCAKFKLQTSVRTSFDEVLETGGQKLWFIGETGHAEVNGLVGQTAGTALIVRNEEDLDKVDYSWPVYFFSQTTKSSSGFEKMRSLLEQRSKAAQQKKFRTNSWVPRYYLPTSQQP